SREIRPCETLGLLGDSGSGKAVTALSIMRLVQPPGRIASGRVLFKGRDLLTLGERDMQRVRGAEISLIFQEPMTALNPVFRIGDQIGETLLVHGRTPRRQARAKATHPLRPVRIPNPDSRLRPHRRDRSGARDLSKPRPSVYARPACVDAWRAARRTAARNRGIGAAARRIARRLRVHAAVPRALRALPDRAAP